MAALMLAAGLLPSLTLAHEGHDHGAPARAAIPEAVPPPVVSVPDAAQWRGRVVPDPRRVRPIVADQPGRIDPVPGGFPAPGTRVRAQQVLGWLTPTLPVPARRDLDAELTTARRDARFGRIQIERFNVDEAQATADELSRPTPSLQILGEYRSAQAREGDLARGLNERIPLVAPADATLLSSRAQAGSVVDAGDALFELDTADGVVIELRGADGVSDPRRLAALVDAKPVALELLSDRFDPVARTRVLLFSPSDAGSLAPGQPVRLVEAAAASTSGAASRAPSRRVTVTKPVQRLLGLRTVLAGERSTTTRLAGEVIARPDQAAIVQSTEAGRLDAPAGGWPLAGRRVAKDDVLAILHPQMGAAERARRQASLAQIDQKLNVARINLERLKVQTEGGGAPATGNVYLDQAALEFETLARLRALAVDSLEGQVELRAGTDGVLATVTARPGDVVAAGRTIFTIADASRVRVAVRTFDPGLAGRVQSARAVAPGQAAVRITYRGQEVAADAGWRLFFDAEGPLLPGQVVDVELETTAAAIHPATCTDGTDHVWIHVAPEIFESRPACQPAFAGGERIVVQGGAILDQYR